MQRLKFWLAGILVTLFLASLLPVILLRWIPPPTSAVMLERQLSENKPQAYQWVPLQQISPYVALAVVASEDQKFPKHLGFDVASIQVAMEEHADGKRLRGASTITQQVARNLFLWQGRSFLRKGLEAWMTLLLELVWSKQRILEVYLNIAEMGPHTFGVQAAATAFFSRPAATLSREQAALLATVLPNPRKMQANRPSAYMLGRRDDILYQMQVLGGVCYLRGIVPNTTPQMLHCTRRHD